MSNSTAAPPEGPRAVDESSGHAPPRAAGRRWRDRGASLASGMGKRTLLALADQTLVSGVRFGLTLVVGRLAGKTELGVYSLGFSWIVVFACIQEALITIPFTAYAARYRGRRRVAFRSAVWRHHAALAAAAAAGVAATAVLMFVVWRPSDRGVQAAGALILAIPCSLAWEFGRRVAFADERVELALGCDAVAAALQLAGVALLYQWQALTAASCLAASAAAWLVAGVISLIATKSFAAVSTPRTLVYARRNWSMSRWMLSSQLVRTIDIYLPFWVAAYLIADGERAAGELAACLTLITVTNPILIGVTNVLGPKLARSFAEGGIEAVGRTLSTARWWLFAMLSVIAFVAVFAGDEIITALFGDEYQGLQRLTTMLALVILTLPWNFPVGTALWAMDRADVDFRIGVVCLALHLVLSIPLTLLWGLPGTVVAILVVSMFAALARTRAVHVMLVEHRRLAGGAS